MIFLLPILILLSGFLAFPKQVLATVDPLSTPNNKFGIHIISATSQEASEAASLVNSSGGDWGYVTLLIESKDRDVSKWQQIFDDLRRKHLIPIVRLATKPVDDYWERPYEKEYEAWADFLDKLNWPIKNRYVIIYNEPNQGKEWGNFVDPKLYAETLDQTITALKNKNRNFFVLNAGFDASAPQKPPQFFDEETFLDQMSQAIPGIFNKLDGWVSHSYPNPGFVGSPMATGRGTVNTWGWELGVLKNFGLTKSLPVFITETGWRHAEGLKNDYSLPTSETVGEYFKLALENAWSDNKIVAVTPFLLNYQNDPFDHFSFKKITGEKQDTQILGVSYPDYYSQYESLMALSKNKGEPVQENKAKLIKGEVFKSLVVGEEYEVFITLKNMGQSIWNSGTQVVLTATEGGKNLGISPIPLPSQLHIEPGQEYTFPIRIKASLGGVHKVVLNLFSGNKPFDSPAIEFTTEVKSPVSLLIKSTLAWGKNPQGNYMLKVTGPLGDTIKQVSLDSSGQSREIEARFLLPDYSFEFILEKPFYKSKKIQQVLKSGTNTLNFDTLQPDILSAIFHPLKLWKLLPF